MQPVGYPRSGNRLVDRDSTRSEVMTDDGRSKYVEKLLSSRNGISTIVKYHRQSRWLGW